MKQKLNALIVDDEEKERYCLINYWRRLSYLKISDQLSQLQQDKVQERDKDKVRVEGKADGDRAEGRPRDKGNRRPGNEHF